MKSKVHKTFKWPLKKHTKIGFQYQLSLNAGQKYCKMLHGEYSATLSTSIKLPFFIKTLVLSIFKLPLISTVSVLTCNYKVAYYLQHN